MSRTPAAVWIVDTNKEHLAVEEARKLRIPIVGILDSNCDPDLVDFPIPGNDDAIRAVGLLTRVVADAVAEGLIARSGAKTEGARPSAPTSRWPTGSASSCSGDAEKAAVAATGGDAAKDETPAAEATGAAAEAPEAAAAAEAVTEAPAAEETEAAAEATAEAAERRGCRRGKPRTRRRRAAAPRASTAPTRPPRSRTARLPRASRSRATRTR